MRQNQSGSSCGWSIDSEYARATLQVSRALRARAAAFVALLLSWNGTPLQAQQSPRLTVEPPQPSRATVDGPLVAAHDMLDGSDMHESLVTGFPARLHFVVELWSADGFFNNRLKRAEYDIVVQYVALDKVYQITLVEVDRQPFSLGRFARIEDAALAVARPRRVPMSAPANSRALYYQVTLAVDNVQVSDIDELNAWLRGEVRPAVSGKRNAGTALSRTLRSFAARILGGGTREYRETTERFAVP